MKGGNDFDFSLRVYASLVSVYMMRTLNDNDD